MPRQYKYLYGPVPSRRLGRSLGIDIVPLKVCTLDCVYCQLGRSSEKTTRRREYVPIDAVIEELAEKISNGLDADFITIAGSGEPTLNSGLGKLLKAASDITDIPLTVLTNGTLFYREDVRADCAQADVVMPSLDAGDEPTFRKINRPHRDISIEKLVSGLCALREEFAGRIWLEVFLVDGMNTDTGQIAEIKGLIRICYCNIYNLAHLTITSNCPGIRHNIRQLLLGVVNDKITNNGVRPQGNKRVSIGISFPAIGQKDRPYRMLRMRHAAAASAQGYSGSNNN